MIAVSGANGFLGAHFIIECLRRNIAVSGFHRSGASLEYFNSLITHYQLDEKLKDLVTWKEVNYLDPLDLRSAMKDHDTFVHCAGMICFDNKLERQLIKANRDITEKIINACVDLKFKKFLYTSSIATTSYQERNQGKIESRFDSAYGLSKFLGELEVLRGEEEGLECFTIRPGVILGPPPPSNEFNNLYDWIKRGYHYAPNGSTGVVEVQSVAKYMLDLISDLGIESNIAISKNITFKELIANMAEQMGTEKRLRQIPNSLLKLISSILKGIYFFSSKAQPLPRPAVRAMISTSYYPDNPFSEKYSPAASNKSLLKNMVDYLSRSGKL